MATAFRGYFQIPNSRNGSGARSSIAMAKTWSVLFQTTKAQNSQPVTIRDVAELAGVSTATVSNVINSTGKVSEPTREKVRAAIQRMKWTPNVDARNLAKATPAKKQLGGT